MSVSNTPLQGHLRVSTWNTAGGIWDRGTHFFVFEVTNLVVGFWRFRVSRIGLIYSDSRVRSSVNDDSS